MKHKLSNINKETRTGDCAVCGTNVPLSFIRQRSWRCRTMTRLEGKTNRRRQRLKKQGCDSDDHYKQELSKSGGICTICKEKMKRPEWDHCHKSGKFRGFLCHGCNAGLGHFRDNVLILEAAIRYLKK